MVEVGQLVWYALCGCCFGSLPFTMLPAASSVVGYLPNPPLITLCSMGPVERNQMAGMPSVNSRVLEFDQSFGRDANHTLIALRALGPLVSGLGESAVHSAMAFLWVFSHRAIVRACSCIYVLHYT